ncbi:N-acetylmuramoyl-L-alanine amidase [Oceanobacter sp. 5_MG-2023]|uniref:N-acetylmuramoyl-L-alanine amidase n=1 Tax=Oceanobacter sp. 5_MG-2023 TaxID=3062645 RepID=UPI0026E12C6F|nr:N-acetylmuramoyl-L-alanine amidase [Oceanobacter sp. 5_MG-2023]MDO6682397.1 N-acetylmuramoyl-L-alanine amidase [Oceanobacter sp. 5_MG-2023]
MMGITLKANRATVLGHLCRCACWLLALTGSVLVQADVRDIRVWQSPDSTRLVFDLTEPSEHKIFPLSSPSRVVIDLNDAEMLLDTADIDLEGTAVASIRIGHPSKKVLRIVLDLDETLKPSSFPLPPNDVYANHRLVVDLKRPETTQSLSPVKPVKQAETSAAGHRDIIVAIDAGHGGEDPGASGSKGTQEKHVVLAIAKELQALLKKEAGFTPFMVRTGDYYIGLRERTEKARSANSDFLVSIHADAFMQASANGSSVYVLSDRGATSETARWLADKENNADLVGGISLEDKDDHLKMTLLDLSMTYQRNSSKRIGADILGYMKKISYLHKRQVEEAAFVVLKAPDIPALLVETGFISNPEEERKLGTRKYQRQMATAIFNGIKDYFSEHPPSGTLLEAQRQRNQGSGAHSYVIRSGDTLSDLAIKHGVGLNELRRVNGLNSDQIRIGQTIKIPGL